MAEPYHAPPALGLVQPTPEASPAGAAPDASGPLVPTGQAEVGETLEELAREGARRMLERALHSEVDAYLGRRRYDRADDDGFSGYRNGYARDREISVGTWAVEVRPPRVADTPPHIPPFRSSILPRGRSLTHETQRLFARLYLEGLSSGDFEPAFRELLGTRAALSSSTILRLKEDWRAEYTVWRSRPITGRYAYCWADGIYLGVGAEAEHSCLLVVIGARADGRKELLAMELGYRESTASWADVLRDLRDRGLETPMLAVGDGALGLWAALREVFPETAHQRCWNHKAMNLTDKVPKRLQPELRHRLRAVWNAPSRRECELRRDELAHWLHARGQDPAAETLSPRLGRPHRLLRLPGRALDPPAHQQPSRVGLRRGAPAHERVQADAPPRLRALPRVQDHPAARARLAAAQRRADPHDAPAGRRPLRRRDLHPGRRRSPERPRGGGDSGLIPRQSGRVVSTQLDEGSLPPGDSTAWLFVVIGDTSAPLTTGAGSAPGDGAAVTRKHELGGRLPPRPALWAPMPVLAASIKIGGEDDAMVDHQPGLGWPAHNDFRLRAR